MPISGWIELKEGSGEGKSTFGEKVNSYLEIRFQMQQAT